MKLAKLTMKGTALIASLTFQAGGVVKTGLAWSTRSTFGVIPANSVSSDGRSASGADGSTDDRGVKNRPPGVATLPASALSALTASAVNRPLVCASGGP